MFNCGIKGFSQYRGRGNKRLFYMYVNNIKLIVSFIQNKIYFENYVMT